MLELVRLYEGSVKPVPWKFVVYDSDSYWPVKWFLWPAGEGLWVVKKRSPDNVWAEERFDLVGIRINGETRFVETEWNNEVLYVRREKEILRIFEDVVRGKYSGVAIEENWEPTAREAAEKWHRMRWVVKLLWDDRERWRNYGELTFSRYIESEFGEWLTEFRGLFEKLAKSEDRERFLKSLSLALKQEGFQRGFFMYVYYP
jgi:hypothetical protein